MLNFLGQTYTAVHFHFAAAAVIVPIAAYRLEDGISATGSASFSRAALVWLAASFDTPNVSIGFARVEACHSSRRWHFSLAGVIKAALRTVGAGVGTEGLGAIAGGLLSPCCCSISISGWSRSRPRNGAACW